MKKISGDTNIYHKCTKNHDHMLYCSWDMTCDRCDCYFSLWTFFALSPPTSPKNKNFKKMQKTPGDIVLLNYHHSVPKTVIICFTVDMMHDRSNFYFSFWAIFLPFILLTAQKIKISEWKNLQEISQFYKCVPKIMIRWCTVPEI